jgi:hypothetical protein
MVASASAASAAGSSAASSATAVPRGLLPMATSWLTPQRGVVLGYPSRTTGAKPYLLVTGNGGRTWQSLSAPPVRYPADNDQPDMTWAGGVIAVTDGTHIVVTRDGGRHWSAERLVGVSGTFYIDRRVIASARVFALVNKGTSEAVYSGLAKGGVLRAVRGLSITGSEAYGDISTVGVLQVDLGNDYAAERYWYSRDGVHFVAAPLPCPVTTVALLGGVRAGKVIALCSGSPSDVGLGENDKQVSIAARLGGTFGPSGPVFDSPNELGFATASAKDMTFATAFPLVVTFNAGRTWTYELTQPNGASWNDLAFSSATTGTVVCDTINNASKEIGAVYRTIDGGHVWHALTLP